jgi:hypothetical protein
VNRLPREAINSPLVEHPSARMITISLDYSW